MNSKASGVKLTAISVGVAAMCWMVLPGPVRAQEPASGKGEGLSKDSNEEKVPEMGLRCIDGIDNDGNGLRDCDDPVCQGVAFCLDKIYYTPEPFCKPMALYMSLAAGLAFPNWNPPNSEGQQDASGNPYVVPYLPDIGPMGDLTLLHFVSPWIGLGIKGLVAVTNVQSRDKWYEEDHYKFDGIKLFLNMSFVTRFQYVIRNMVPYANLIVGYSYAQYRWVTFTRFGDETDTMMTLDRIIEPASRHMTIAAEIGMDVFIIPRTIAVGAKAFLPIAATGGGGMDNTGLMFTIAYTPLWKEKRAIRPEYLRKNGIF